MSKVEVQEFFVDPSRCIGCNACVQASSECDTHNAYSMIQLDFIDHTVSPQTVPIVCVPGESPTWGGVLRGVAVKPTEDGTVQTAKRPRCIACINGVLACPVGVQK